MENGPRFLTETDINNLDTAQQIELGAVGVTGDGRRFRYVKFGGTSTINSGLLVVAAAQDTNSTALAISTANTTAQLSAGSTSLIITNGATSVTQDEFAGGYLDVLGTNAVSSYQIAGNNAAGNAGAITVLLTDTLRNTTALANGTNTVNLTRPFAGVNTSTTKSQVVGATIMPVPNSSTVTNFGWVQTSGHALLSATTATKGQAFTQDTAGTAGFIMSTAAATDYPLGIVKESAASSTAQVDLAIA